MTLRMCVAAAAAILLASPSGAADQTWTGQISDAMCGKSHGEMGSKKMSDKECTLMCAKSDGSYVFVTDGKVFKIANPNAKGIEEHAGETVKLTGTAKGNAITVTNIEPATQK